MVTAKLDQEWEPYYRIVKQMESVSFIMWDHQMSGRVTVAHANDQKLAEVDSWEGT